MTIITSLVLKSACNNKNKDNNITDTNNNANNNDNSNDIGTNKTKDSINGTNVTIRRKKNKYNNNGNIISLSCHEQVFKWATFREILLPSSGKVNDYVAHI